MHPKRSLLFGPPFVQKVPLSCCDSPSCHTTPPAVQSRTANPCLSMAVTKGKDTRTQNARHSCPGSRFSVVPHGTTHLLVAKKRYGVVTSMTKVAREQPRKGKHVSDNTTPHFRVLTPRSLLLVSHPPPPGRLESSCLRSKRCFQKSFKAVFGQLTC